MTLEELANQARELANALFSDKATACRQKTKCLQAEQARPLTREEKREGLERRTFDYYDHNRLCGGCRAYWFQEMAAQQLYQLRCHQRRAEAVEERNAAR